MQAYSDPSRESDPFALPDIEIFHMTAEDFLVAEKDTWGFEAKENAMADHPAESNEMARDDSANNLSGFYYWFCFPGCMPDGEPIGPFENEAQALNDAREF